MSTPNPYAAPKSAVADETLVNKGDFVPQGRGTDAGRGWAWIADAWGIYARSWGLWIGIAVVLGIIFVGMGLIPFLGSFLTMLLWPVFLAGLAAGCRAIDQGGELEFNHLFAGFRERTGPLIGIGALSLVATLIILLVIVLTMGAGVAAMMVGGGDPETMDGAGLIALLLALLIMMALMVPVAMATWFAPPLVMFHDMSPFDALKASFSGCLKNIVPFLLYGVVLFLFCILATIPLALGWLVLLPVLWASIYTSYRDIYFKPPG